MLTKVSPTQISAFAACPRKWYFGWVLKQRAPQTDSQRNGSTVHKALEDFMQDKTDLAALRKRRDQGERFLASAIHAIEDGKVPVLPAGALIEERTRALELSGVKGNGLIDLVLPPVDGKPYVRDWKTCKTFRFIQTEDSLRHDTQAVFYAGEIVARGIAAPNGVLFEHFYLSTTSAEYRPIQTTLGKAFLEQKLLDLTGTVDKMKHTSGLTLAQVPKDTTACGAFGGCPHMTICHTTNVALDPKRGLMAGLAGLRNRKTETPAESRSLLAQKLDAATPPPPTRKQLLEARLKIVFSALEAGNDVAALSEDMEVLVEDGFTVSGAFKFLDEHGVVLDDLSEDEWAEFYGDEPSISEPSSATEEEEEEEEEDASVYTSPAPPDAAENNNPTPDERDLRSYGLGGRTVAPLERNGIDTLPKLVTFFQAGKPFSDLEGVGQAAENECLRLLANVAFEGNVPAAAPPASDNEEMSALRAEVAALRAAKPAVPSAGEPEGLTLYLGCVPSKGVQATEIEDVMAAMLGDLSPYYGAGYDDGKKAVAQSIIANADKIAEQYPHIVGTGGLLSFAALEALVPFASRIVRGTR